MNEELERFKNMQNDTDCQILAKQIEMMSLICAGNPHKVVDLITGYLWDEKEADNIKRYIK